MAGYIGVLGCEQTCMDSCTHIPEFIAYNLCVEECMFYCVTAKEKPARLANL